MKRFSVLLGALTLLAFLSFSAKADARKTNTPMPTFTLYAGDAVTAPDDALENMPLDLIRAESPLGNRDFCLVIPENWNAENLRIYFDAETLLVNGTEYRSGDVVSLPLDEVITVAPPVEGAIEMSLTVCQTGGLPVLWMTSESGNEDYIHAVKGNSEPGYLRYVETDGTVAYDGKLTQIRGRGNATFDYDKKPYQIKLAKSASLAGMHKDKTWVLLANFLDRTEIRNTMILDLARFCGVWSFVPACKSVDVYLNHDYKGTYLLCEKIEVDSGRLDIRNLEEETEKANPRLDFSTLKPQGELGVHQRARKYYDIPLEPEDITGGYYVRMDYARRYPSEAGGFITAKGATFILQSPKYPTEAQANYIADLFQDIESALYDKNGISSISGRHFTEIIDLTTMVYRYVLAEVADDYDGQRSNYYKDADGKDPMVYVGPVWDQDNTWGVYKPYSYPTQLHIYSDTDKPYYWFRQVNRHKVFTDAANEAYREKFLPALAVFLGEEKDPTGALRSIDEYAAEVRQSALCDAVRWPYSIMRSMNSRVTRYRDETFDGLIEYLRNYITKRRPALNRHFGVKESQ